MSKPDYAMWKIRVMPDAQAWVDGCTDIHLLSCYSIRINNLAAHVHPILYRANVVKLKNSGGWYRCWIDRQWRIVFRVDRDSHSIIIDDIRHKNSDPYGDYQ